MLDKSIVYKDIIMMMERGKLSGLAAPVLPLGFSYYHYKPGDEAHWARIETSVLEFDAEQRALDYFTQNYLHRAEQLAKRCMFIHNRHGLPIATATAWFRDDGAGHRATLDWVAVCPEYQGLGLGRAVVTLALMNFPGEEPNSDIYLHTQTWSHVAVKLYHSLGFNMVKHSEPPQKNDYAEAITVLRQVLDNDLIERLVQSAI